MANYPAFLLPGPTLQERKTSLTMTATPGFSYNPSHVYYLSSWRELKETVDTLPGTRDQELTRYGELIRQAQNEQGQREACMRSVEGINEMSEGQLQALEKIELSTQLTRHLLIEAG